MNEEQTTLAQAIIGDSLKDNLTGAED
jgi:hypothetical protein